MKNKRKSIAILLIIVLIILLITLFIYQKLTTSKVNYEVSIDGKTEKRQLLFSGIWIVSEKYTGNVERKDISEGLSDIIKEYLPGIKDDTKMKTEKGLEKYYKKHQNTIIKELGIENSQEFIALVKKMKSSSANFKKWDKLTINKDSFVDRKNDDYSYFEMTVTYDNNKSVDYSVYLANDKKMYPRFKVGIKKW